MIFIQNWGIYELYRYFSCLSGLLNKRYFKTIFEYFTTPQLNSVISNGTEFYETTDIIGWIGVLYECYTLY